MQRKPLSTQVVAVTGASSGVGRAIARAFGAAGAKVGLIARGRDGLRAAAEEIRKAGGEAVVIPCNISDKAQCENLIAQARKQLGPIDVLVCNAASNPYYGPNEKLPYACLIHMSCQYTGATCVISTFCMRPLKR